MVWSIYLDRYIWGNEEFDIHVGLLFSGFAAKTFLNEDCQCIQEHIIRNKKPDFSKSYNEWLKQYRNTMMIPPREMNAKFQKISCFFSEKQDLTDYRFYVDEIVTSSNVN